MTTVLQICASFDIFSHITAHKNYYAWCNMYLVVGFILLTLKRVDMSTV